MTTDVEYTCPQCGGPLGDGLPLSSVPSELRFCSEECCTAYEDEQRDRQYLERLWRE